MENKDKNAANKNDAQKNMSGKAPSKNLKGGANQKQTDPKGKAHTESKSPKPSTTRG